MHISFEQLLYNKMNKHRLLQFLNHIRLQSFIRLNVSTVLYIESAHAIKLYSRAKHLSINVLHDTQTET